MRTSCPRIYASSKEVVESEDLPLNVSRETLQENLLVAKIRDTLTKKLLGEFKKLAESDEEAYNGFWRSFGRTLKEGYSDFANREALQELLRFNSSHHQDAEGLCGLAAYVERMPGAQKAIYYLSGASRDALKVDPRLEIFRKKNVEVLYLSDVADEFVLGSFGQFGEHQLVSADQVTLEDLKDIGPDDEDADDAKKKEEAKASEVDIAPLLKRFKNVLGERVKDVTKSERLVDSPACLVSDEASGHMDKMIRLMNKDASLPQRTLELNAGHALVQDLQRLFDKDGDDPLVERACEQIFEAAMLADGYLQDPHQLLKRMYDTLGDAASLKAKD